MSLISAGSISLDSTFKGRYAEPRSSVCRDYFVFLIYTDRRGEMRWIWVQGYMIPRYTANEGQVMSGSDLCIPRIDTAPGLVISKTDL